MSQTGSDQGLIPGDPTLVRWNAAFLFATHWKITNPDGVSTFPPGGGLIPPEVSPPGGVVIQVPNLTGLSAADANAAIHQCSSALALVAQALALAQLQLAAAQATLLSGS